MMRLSSPGGVHAGVVAVLTRLVGKADKRGVVNTSILLGRKEKPEVAVLTSVKFPLDRRRVHRQDLVALLYGGVFGIDLVLG